jgi:2-keto-4-pentenoate hydratase/2-oxohepta-3-ene-1,7-dioic acid hydratase in catechol pathway
MKIARCWDPVGNDARFGVIEGDVVFDVEGSVYEDRIKPGRGSRPLEGLRLLAPCTPTKIIMGGLNYVGHAKETGAAIPKVPGVLQKPISTLIGHEEPIQYPPETNRLEYEGELAVVIRRRMRNVEPADVPACVLGYAPGNDVTARDVCRDGNGRLGLIFSKSWDTFCPVGPWLETDLDPDNVDLTVRVDGEVRQHVNTSDMIFPVANLLSYISYFMTLLPGDLILTGTPSGIGGMNIGQTCEVEVSGIGTLRNPIVASPRRAAGEASKYPLPAA